MAYLMRRPSGRLAGVVERLWLVEDNGADLEPQVICPDGRTEVVLHLGDPMRERGSAGERLQPRFLLIGQMSRALAIVPTGRIAMVGARFAPGAMRNCLPIAQGELEGRIVGLDSVWSQWTRRTADAVAAAPRADARLQALERALEDLIPDRGVQPATAIDHAVASIEASGGRASLDRLAMEAGFSRRQLERRFRDDVGLSPALFARIVKFQRAFHALGTASGAQIAARCGYADQAHMVREMRRFGGATPGTLASLDAGLTKFFTD